MVLLDFLLRKNQYLNEKKLSRKVPLWQIRRLLGERRLNLTSGRLNAVVASAAYRVVGCACISHENNRAVRNNIDSAATMRNTVATGSHIKSE